MLLKFFMCMHECGHVCTCMYHSIAGEIRGKLTRLSSLLTPCRPWGSNPGCQVWWKVSLPSIAPPSDFFHKRRNQFVRNTGAISVWYRWYPQMNRWGNLTFLSPHFTFSLPPRQRLFSCKKRSCHFSTTQINPELITLSQTQEERHFVISRMCGWAYRNRDFRE